MESPRDDAIQQPSLSLDAYSLLRSAVMCLYRDADPHTDPTCRLTNWKLLQARHDCLKITNLHSLCMTLCNSILSYCCILFLYILSLCDAQIISVGLYVGRELRMRSIF